MKRKIIKQGHNTLTITLPSDWVKRFNLKAGEEISLLEKDNGLFLTTEKINNPSEIEINVENLSIPLIWKHVSSAYREGYDKIKVKFSPNTTYDSPYGFFAHYIIDPAFAQKRKLSPQEFFQLLIDRFIGFEIMEERDDFCILKQIGQSTSKEFDNSLRRIFLLLLYISEGIIKDVEKGSKSFLDNVHNVDIQVDKFHDFCTRVLNKTEFEQPLKTSLIFTLIYLLELVGDEFKHLAIQLRKKDAKDVNSKKISNSLDFINEQLKIFYELYYKYDKEKLIALLEMNEKFTSDEINKKNKYKEDVEVTIEAINRYIYTLSEILIEKQASISRSV